MSRSSGRSAVAAAAYRSGQKLTNERDGLTHDFTRKGGIAHSEIVLPEGSNGEWAKDRSRLWNAAEHSEKRKDEEPIFGLRMNACNRASIPLLAAVCPD